MVFFKSAAMSLIAMYREKSGCCLCGHFVQSRISATQGLLFAKEDRSTAVAIQRGSQAKLSVGDIEAVRDWGYAGDFVRPCG